MQSPEDDPPQVRLRHRNASLLDLPSARFLARRARAGGCTRACVRTTTWRVAFSFWLPRRESRRRLRLELNRGMVRRSPFDTERNEARRGTGGNPPPGLRSSFRRELRWTDCPRACPRAFFGPFRASAPEMSGSQAEKRKPRNCRAFYKGSHSWDPSPVAGERIGPNSALVVPIEWAADFAPTDDEPKSRLRSRVPLLLEEWVTQG